MILNTIRFGPVDFPDDKILYFPAGLLGFEKEERFALLPFTDEGNCPLECLQSVQEPKLGFVVTDPHIFVPDYAVDLLETERAEIELLPDQSFALRVILTVPNVYIDMTANLVGPIVINPEKMIGKQFVLTIPQYDTRHRLFPKEVRDSETMFS